MLPAPAISFHAIEGCPADRWVTKQTGWMGDSFSWFGLGCRSGVPVHGNARTAQFSFEAIDHADRGVEETDLPVAGFGLFDGDCLADEGAADVDEGALPFDLAVGADFADSRLGRIGRFGK